MNCCSNCFSDYYLQNYIHRNSNVTGKCSFCRTNKHYPLLNPSVLIDLFQPLFDLYTIDENGIILTELLQLDWQIFSEQIDKQNQIQLISIMTDDENIHLKKFQSNLIVNKSYIDKWDEFTKELKEENRFFPKNAIEIEELIELLNYLLMPKESIPKIIYRARIDRNSTNFKIEEMGKPPIEKSADGRANPKGISYFYGSSEVKTAIAETRPYKTDVIFVAKFKVASKIKLIDLRNPKITITPFEFDDDSLNLLHNEHMPFLVHLQGKLSKPVLPTNKELEYLPTQYLCELIKDQGFHGIAFKSSLEKGDNYVLFDDSLLKAQKLDKYTVSEIEIKSIKFK